MKRYEIRCTEEQTKKALELGAPITEFDSEYKLEERMSACGDIPAFGSFDDYLNKDEYPDICVLEIDESRYAYALPTTEQMKGWIEDTGNDIRFEVTTGIAHTWHYYIHIGYNKDYLNLFNSGYSSREEATLAAIDAALEYLANKK